MGLRRRWNDYSIQDLFILADTQSGFPTLYSWRGYVQNNILLSWFYQLFEWVVMTFGLKNAGVTYQRAMNLIFHDLLGIILEIYIDDIVVKSDSMDSHLADL
jgi:hypothetical protein